MKNWTWRLLVLFVALALMLVSTTSAKAQTGFTHLWSFDADSNPYTLTHGATVGFHSGISRTADDLVVWDEDRAHLGFDVTVPSGTITSLTWIEAYVDYFGLYRNWAITITPSVGAPVDLSWSDTIGSPHTWVEDLETPVDCSGGGCTISWTGNTSHTGADYAVLEFSITVEGTSDPWEGTTGPFQPVRVGQQAHVDNPSDDSGHPDKSILIASPDRGKDIPVYASHSGTITHVDQNWTRGGTFSIEYQSDDVDDMSHAYTLFYENLAEVFVKPGDHVNAGCIIGIAGPPDVGYSSTYPDGSYGEVIFGVFSNTLGYYVDWSSYDDPSGSQGCGSNQSSQHCINSDPRFTDPATFWGTGTEDFLASMYDGNPTLSQGAVRLPYGHFIYQDIRSSSPPSGVKVTIVASVPTHSLGKLHVSLSDASDDVTLSYDGTRLGEQLIVTTAALYPTVADFSPDVYRLKISNQSDISTDVILNFVCMAFGDTVQIAPPACYFNDTGEILESDPWTFSGSGTAKFVPSADSSFTQFGNSLGLTSDQSNLAYIQLNNRGGDAIATHDLSLPAYADKPTDYVLEGKGALVDFSPLQSISSLAPHIHVWIYQSNTDTEPTYLGDFTITNLLFGQWFIFQFSLPTNTPITDGLIALANTDLGELEPGHGTIEVRRICLHPANGVWAGYENADYTPLPPGAHGAGTGADTGDNGTGGFDNGGGDTGNGSGNGQAKYLPPQCYGTPNLFSLPATPETPTTPDPLDVPGWLNWVGLYVVGWLNWIGTLFGVAIQWLGLWMDYLLQCTLYPVLAQMVARLMGFVWWLGMLGRWMSATATAFSQWLLRLIAYEINIALALLAGFFTQIWNALMALPIMQWLYDHIAFLGIVFSALLDILAGIVGIVLGIVNTIGSLIHVALIFWQAIIGAINDTSTVATGIPRCSTVASTDFFYAFCATTTLMGHVIDLWPAILLLVSVPIAALVWWVMMTGFNWVSKTLAEVG